jgi:hypothetical protein
VTATRLRAGVGRTDLTPEGTVPLSGYGNREQPSTGVHDGLAATALVLSDSGTRVGLVSADLLNVSTGLRERVRRRVADCDLDAVVLAATHTHAGPYVPAPAIDVHPTLSSPETGHVDAVEDALVEALRGAAADLSPAALRVGRAECEVARNRRAEGGVSGNVRAPQGATDPEVLTLEAVREAGPDAVLVSFACHPTCTTGRERRISADWPGVLRRRLEGNGVWGDGGDESEGGSRGESGGGGRGGGDTERRVLFWNGACGDLNPRQWAGDREGEAVYEHMAEIGTAVADAAREALGNVDRTATDAPLFARRRDLRLPVRETPSREALESRLADLDAALDEEISGVGADRLRADRTYVEELLAIEAWDATHLPATVRHVSAGGIELLTLPGEVFVAHGLDCKQRAGDGARDLFVATYADAYPGYVPRLADLPDGGYEVRTMKVAPEAITRVRRAAFDLLE